ncbi:MAG: hypothetical protein RMJ43_07195 [Chloroherpetonaceae bacterium]|nr:hypothetical protein [Chloroherpetonaceae bacterium]
MVVWRRAVVVALEVLHAVALGVWSGGSVVLCWLVWRAGGGGVVGDVARWFSGVVEVCGVVVVGVQFVLRRRYAGWRVGYVWDGVRQLVTFGAFFAGEWVRYSVLGVGGGGGVVAWGASVWFTGFEGVAVVVGVAVGVWLSGWRGR